MHFSTGQISKLLSREKSAGIYTRTRRNIFHSVHIFHHPSLRGVLPWDWQGEGGGATSRPFIFIEASLVEAFQEGRKEREKEKDRERERNTSTAKKNHTRDMIVVRQRAFNQVGFMGRRSGPEVKVREEKDIGSDAKFRGRVLRRGGKCRRGRARP